MTGSFFIFFSINGTQHSGAAAPAQAPLLLDVGVQTGADQLSVAPLCRSTSALLHCFFRSASETDAHSGTCVHDNTLDDLKHHYSV